ncbi:unnamed protein product [Haemonchus placei]|uniref:G_PROTEIN_RECEP_F1_2 domain-containing protein n=1 Tax=Haemonchus placei TaxID=6290 RepID=A0A0N4W1E8_HAEPC|nr:unnamed protein product [Haemonchus placei]
MGNDRGKIGKDRQSDQLRRRKFISCSNSRLSNYNQLVNFFQKVFKLCFYTLYLFIPVIIFTCYFTLRRHFKMAHYTDRIRKLQNKMSNGLLLQVTLSNEIYLNPFNPSTHRNMNLGPSLSFQITLQITICFRLSYTLSLSHYLLL